MSVTSEFESSELFDNRQRRLLISKEIKNLGKCLPFTVKKSSQIRYLKAACSYIRKEKHFNSLKSKNETKFNSEEISLKYCKDYFSNEKFFGFVLAFSREGRLICLSETDDYLGQNQESVLFLFDYIQELACNEDQYIYRHLLENHVDFFEANSFSFFTHLKINSTRRSKTYFKMFKMTGHFDVLTNMFITKCVPILQDAIMKKVDFFDPTYFTIIHKFTLKISELDVNCVNILGYKKEELINKKSLYDLINVKYLQVIRDYHKSMVENKEQKCFTTTVQLEHKSGIFLDCIMNMSLSSSRTIICNFQLLSDIEIKYYKKYLSRISFTGLSETILEEKINEESEEELEEVENETIEELRNTRKRKISTEFVENKKKATGSIKSNHDSPLEPLDPLEIVEQSAHDSFLMGQETFQIEFVSNSSTKNDSTGCDVTKSIANQSIEGEWYSPLESYDLFATFEKVEQIGQNEENQIRVENQIIQNIKDCSPTNNVERPTFFQGFSEIVFSPESEFDSSNSNQQNFSDEGVNLHILDDDTSEESIQYQLQFFDVLSS